MINQFFVSASDDGKTLVIKRPLEHVYVDLWDTTLDGVRIARKIADLLNELKNEGAKGITS